MMRINVSYSKCLVHASFDTTCPACGVLVKANTPHECSQGETPAPAKRVTSMFTVGQKIRYKPGSGTYGYEDVLCADGRLAGVVVGYTRTRVRVRLTLDFSRIGGRVQHKERCVDAASLVLEAQA